MSGPYEVGASINAYAALKAAGHSAAKAAEIVLDAKRGDKYARDWIARAAILKAEGDGEAGGVGA